MSRARDLADSADLAFDGDTLKIDSTNNRVGIGTSSPVYKTDITSASDADLLQIKSTANANNTALRLGISGNDSYLNASGGSTGNLAFKTYGTERMRIDSSGNLLVGKTTSGITTAGTALFASGTVNHVADGNSPLYLNRLTSDGEIINLRKDGTTVGSIGTSSGVLTVDKSGGGGLYIANGGTFPRYNGALSDNTQDLGGASYRWQDLYLSGGVYLGGTGSANYLDDYEEGEYTVTFTPTSGSITLSSTIDKCRYTKIGRLVKITGRVNISSVSSPSGIVSISLPFANASLGGENAYFAAAPVLTHDVDLPTDLKSLFIELNQGVTNGRLYYVRDNVSWTNFPAQNFDGSGNEYIYFNISYTTDL